jgi:hypothetical protein
MVFVAMLIASCEERNRVSGSGDVRKESNKKVESVSKDHLDTYMNLIPTLNSVFESHQVKFLSSYSDEDEGFLEIRRIGDHTSALSDEEIAAIKQDVYKAVGAEFPLNIRVNTIAEQSGMAGKISAIDKQGRFLVVSSDKFLDTEKKMPDAAWYGMADDADITFEGKPIPKKDVPIGSSVKVWSEGVMLSSYPGQTSGLRLELTAWDDGTGDASGRVTGLEKRGEGVNEGRIIEVDGVKYQQLPIAQVWIKGEMVSVNDLKVGDRVKIWFAGYEIGPEKMVAKVVIDR